MRKTNIMLIFAVLFGVLTVCNSEDGLPNIVRGSGNVITETCEVSDFHAVVLDGVGRLVIDQTGNESLSITADDNVIPYIETVVKNGKLIISIRNGTTFTNVPDLTYNVTVNFR